MKNIVITLIFIFGITAVSFGQNRVKTVNTYVLVSSNTEHPTLESFSTYQRKKEYSKINKSLLRKDAKITNDHVIYYFKINLKTLFIGTRYKVDRKTEPTN